MGLLTDTKINGNLTTVPEAVRNFLELDDGDRLEWHVEDGEVVVRRLLRVADGAPGADE